MTSDTVLVTVDTLAFTIHDGVLDILLVKRKHDPFKACWALPGGFVTQNDTTLDKAAARELYEETNIGNIYLEQLYTFGDQARDPRGRVVTVAYMALLRNDHYQLKASSESSGVAWWPVNNLPELAFDHHNIISYGHQRLKYKIEYSQAAFKLLADKFTLRELQLVYEAVLGKAVDNRNFRKKFLQSGILQELDETSQESSFRPARLYSFSEVDFEQLPDKPIFVF
jgi:8-oxo-dGTP diphosphatase